MQALESLLSDMAGEVVFIPDLCRPLRVLTLRYQVLLTACVGAV